MIHSTPALLDSLRAHAIACVQDLSARIACGLPTIQGWNGARKVIERLPLDTDQFSLARNRLSNARTYVQAGQRGAARYELRLLTHTLAQR